MKTKAEILAAAKRLEDCATWRPLTDREKRELWLLQQEADIYEFLVEAAVPEQRAPLLTPTMINRDDMKASPPSAFDLGACVALPGAAIAAAIAWNEPDDEFDPFDLPKLSNRPPTRPAHLH